MAFIAPIDEASASEAELRVLQELAVEFGSATNMKRTLVRSKVALDALLEWYPLYHRVTPVLGERLTSLYCHAISSGSECLLCSTYFRRELILSGQDPEDLSLDERDSVVIRYGALLATRPNDVDEGLFSSLRQYFSEAEIVDLTAFGALMIATNVFNSALRIDLDASLLSYQQPPAPHEAGGEVAHG